MHFTISIGGNILAGIAAGALTALVIVAIFAFLGSVMESFMSLGGSGRFLGKLGKGLLICVPIGALIGGCITAAGLPWWSAIIAFVLVILVLNLAMIIRRRRRGY